jgi:heparanase 1
MVAGVDYQRKFMFRPSARAAGAIIALLGTTLLAQQANAPAAIDPAKLTKAGSIDPRFQSFNIEMVEVTGGRFWKPYADLAKSTLDNGNQPAGMSPSLYEYRPPVDLSSPRLRKLAAALGPAYVRVSGTWANTSYFQESNAPAPAEPPKGFKGVLTRKEWKGVVDFANAVDAKIITSFAASAGARNADGVWTPQQAEQLVDYTESLGSGIAGAEFMNEPSFAEMGGAPKGYDAAAYGRDMGVFGAWAKAAAPGMLILGPGAVGEGVPLGPANNLHLLKSEDLLRASDPKSLNVFSYHFYPGVSKRCSAADPTAATIREKALSADYLDSTDKAEAFYAGLRDRFTPGKPMWITETGEAACGGDPWAATFIDSFRYLDQLGSMAQRGVQIVAHNTLAASDYGLLDEKTVKPRPDYWSALLWRKFMGVTVLNPGPSIPPALRVYAHCLRNSPGGVALLVINPNASAASHLQISAPATRYTLASQDLFATTVDLNGAPLEVGADNALPDIHGQQMQPGDIAFTPASITFLAIPQAQNQSCQ